MSNKGFNGNAVDRDEIKRIAHKVLEIELIDGKNPKIKKNDIVCKIKKVIEEEIQ